MKEKYIASALIIFLLFKTTSVFSQNGGLKIPNFSVHSPDVTNLGVYGEYPVDMSTGVPAINIPLHVAKGSKLESPISLSYHASGIKVDQQASFVGLGWILRSGGVVMRAVRGKEDESNYGFKETGKTLPTYNSIEDVQGAGTTGTSAYLKEMFTRDLEPDIFSVSAGDLSAEFCLNNNGEFVSINKEALSYSVDFIEKLIIIKDKMGTIYRFGKSLNGTLAYESTYCVFDNINTAVPFPGDPVSSMGNPYPSAWYLTEMISADLSDTISFTYRDGYYSEYRTTSQTRYFPKNDPFVDMRGMQMEGMITSGMQTSMSNQKVPYKIRYKNGSIEFTTVSDRMDMSANASFPLDRARINGMIVYDDKGSILRTVLFDNANYFDRTGNGSSLTFNTPEYRKKSLKLNGVKFYDKNNAVINEYKFQYDPTPLPVKNAASQDFWGYYNGKLNASLIPETFATYYLGYPMYIGDNRKTDFNFMKAGTLTKIIYPTGGYTQYQYEPNYYLNTNQQQSQTLVNKTLKVFAVNRLPTCDPGFLTNVPVNNTMDFTIADTLGNTSARANLYIYFTDYKQTSGVSMTVRVRDLNNSMFDYSFEHSPSDKSQNKSLSQVINIYQGHTYRVEAKTNGVQGSNYSPCNSPYIEVGISYDYWKTTSVSEIIPEQAGGLRVKSITNYGADNNLLTQKVYEYGNTNYTPGVGKLITEPGKNFYIYPQLYADSDPDILDLKPIQWFTSESQVELGMNHGSPVQYEKVTEKVWSSVFGVSNGKTEFFYTPAEGDYEPNSSIKFSYMFVNYPSWKQSRLAKKVEYKSVGNEYIPIREVVNQYTKSSEERIKTLKIIDYEPDIYAGFRSRIEGVIGAWYYTGDNPRRFYYYNYYVSHGRYLLASETIKEYQDNGEMETTKNIEYNGKFDVSREVFINSKSQQVENKYKYTGDLDYSGLISKNMFSLPVQQEQFVGGKTKGGSILKYNSFGAVSERYVFSGSSPITPVNYVNAESVPSYYEKRQQLTYDQTKKLVKEVLDENGINTVYIWSYNGQYPIAEIKNADYATVETILGGANISNNANAILSNATISSFLAPLRTDSRLKTAMITTYTFDPAYGVTSMTDPRGMISYYEYDNFGRLKLVKDMNGKILKQYEYQYQVPLTQ